MSSPNPQVNQDKKSHRVCFMPMGTMAEVAAGTTLRDAAKDLGVAIEAVCNGRGSCHKCRVRVLEGHFEDHDIRSHGDNLSSHRQTESHLIEKGRMRADERLSCQARVLGELMVYIPDESRRTHAVVRKSLGQREINVDPMVRNYRVELPPATLASRLGDWERLADILEEQQGLAAMNIDLHALRTLPQAQRTNGGVLTVTVWNDCEVIRIVGGERLATYGMAVDLGTTTIAAYLCSLETGEALASASALNPQVGHGDDIMNRIASCNGSLKLAAMQKMVADTLSQLARQLAMQVSITTDDISEIVLVANTVMHHIFLGIDPHALGVVPFAPTVCRSVDIKARDLGISILPSANIHLMPVEAGFVGSDNVAVALAEGPHTGEALQLIIDIGTNGELILGNQDRMLSASCPTGPALEGANLSFGMRATPGAIERVRIDPTTRELRFRVIGNPYWSNKIAANEIGALGICGSAVIDIVAELLNAELIDHSGRFVEEIGSERLRRDTDGRLEFVIAWATQTGIGRDICFTQADIRAVQLAKGALYAGAQVLLRKFGRQQPDKVLIAGAFGSVIDLGRALAIGMFPDSGLENILSVGNAAGDGARIALLDARRRTEADQIARLVEYIELTADPYFNQDFVDATLLPHAEDDFPSLKGSLAGQRPKPAEYA
ncbi:ASKHA domain-containing protein [Denitratisoma oestradiolicum]|uniref:Uncharacterized protein n=1 Tax=Denitratisoma oestradiolicum TaxID=311182 RepID=A0A6S6XZI4_9PROT|nr:ASKHA domain-containing protein [Denitratisoma oestradiolicum]TWO79011.1 hypothetical protein CBW56_16945 [Denitratisoma oestradiolicum]CAB1368329.1 conserved protein of unknown function [Denitratisoma oestradiolicum]